MQNKFIRNKLGFEVNLFLIFLSFLLFSNIILLVKKYHEIKIVYSIDKNTNANCKIDQLIYTFKSLNLSNL